MRLNRNSRISLILFSFFFFPVGGCSSLSLPSLPWSKPTVQPDATAEALFQEGMGYLKNESYLRAIDRFQRVKTEFPFSPQLTAAELKLAEAYYLNKQYPEAVSALKEFQTLHPGNENMPFVVYYLGLSHLDQFTSIDRDQKVTEIAKGYFESVVQNHPTSPYAKFAKEKAAQCRDYLAEHDFYIASFYIREKKYSAARDRLERILRDYPSTATAAKSLYELGETYRAEKNSVRAALAYEALIQRYPDSPLSKQAQVQLAEVEKEKQDPLKLLLMRDGRPASASAEATAANDRQKSQEVNLITKKEIVYEEPGEQKGVFRRVLDTLNPFSSSDNKKKDNGVQKKVEAAKSDPVPAEKSDGFFSGLWSTINPFASGKEKPQVAAARNPDLVQQVDESLKQKGVSNGSLNPAPKPPAVDLPKIDPPVAAPQVDTEALVGQIDSVLNKDGKEGNQLPPTPEIAPAFKTSTAKAATTPPVASKSVSPAAQSASTTGLLSNIDQALKQKGVDSTGLDTSVKTPERDEKNAQPVKPSTQQKIQLDTKLAPEKGPLLLESGEFAPPTTTEGEQEKTATPAPEQQPTPRELPRSVVTTPTPVAPAQTKKPDTPKVAEQKKSPEEEEEKSVLDQLKEDFGRLQGILNPLNW